MALSEGFAGPIDNLAHEQSLACDCSTAVNCRVLHGSSSLANPSPPRDTGRHSFSIGAASLSALVRVPDSTTVAATRPITAILEFFMRALSGGWGGLRASAIGSLSL